MTEVMLDVTVQRSNWYRGRDASDSRLAIGEKTVAYLRKGDPSHQSDANDKLHKMCCLGFACIAAGLTKNDIIDIGFPHSLYNERAVLVPEILNGLIRPFTDKFGDELADTKIARINDRRDITDEEREKQLVEVGKKVGINFTFVD